MTFQLYRLKQFVIRIVSTFSDWALFVGIILIGGIGTHWYMVDSGTTLATDRVGPWISWGEASRRDSDPYARAHFARLGALPLSSEVSRTYVATTDNDGGALHSSCDYAVQGRDFKSTWWSISVFDKGGAVIANPAGRYSFSRDTIAIGADGSFVVSLAREARPGNWLPTGGAGGLAVMLVLQDGLGTIADDHLSPEGDQLPSITRVACR